MEAVFVDSLDGAGSKDVFFDVRAGSSGVFFEDDGGSADVFFDGRAAGSGGAGLKLATGVGLLPTTATARFVPATGAGALVLGGSTGALVLAGGGDGLEAAARFVVGARATLAVFGAAGLSGAPRCVPVGRCRAADAFQARASGAVDTSAVRRTNQALLGRCIPPIQPIERAEAKNPVTYE